MRFSGTTVIKVVNGKITEEIGLDDGVTALTQLGILRRASLRPGRFDGAGDACFQPEADGRVQARDRAGSQFAGKCCRMSGATERSHLDDA